MSFKGFHYIVLAVVVGLIGVFAIHRVISTRTQVATEASSQVIVADADISSGTVLSPRVVKVASWPQSLCPAQTALSVDQINNRVLMVPVFKGEPILMTKLAPEGTAAGLGGLLKVEMRAFTVKVDDVSGVAGFIHPGDHVDVLMSMPSISNHDEQLSKIILQDVNVLTAGQVWERANNNNPVQVNTVTLEVTPDQAEILNLASTQGKIRLVLRSLANKAVQPTGGILTSYLLNGTGKATAVNTTVDKPRPREKTVEVIKGVERSTAKL